MDDGSVGVYVHVPFCERICPYCDFAVVRARRLSRALEDVYTDGLLAELAQRRDDFAGRELATLYFGGGTPSLLHPDSIARLVAAVRAGFPGRSDLEVTLEVNPSTLERERLAGFREAGVNRISLGVQSFDDRVLQRLGRAHRADEARRTLAACGEAGFANLSLDLLFGAPDQTLAGFRRDLEEALGFAPQHLSAYQLTLEPGTPLATAVARGQLVLAPEDEAVEMFEAAERTLEAAGLPRYEISSFARPGFESSHNRRYWERRPVLGLGMGAWSIDPPSPRAPRGARRANRRDLEAYLGRLAAGASPIEGAPERLGEATARGEAVFLALRTRAGLPAPAFEQEFGGPPRRFYAAAIEALVAQRLLSEAGDGSLRLTPRGVLLSDSVFEYFV